MLRGASRKRRSAGPAFVAMGVLAAVPGLGAPLKGVVFDISGAPLPGARLEFAASGAAGSTGADGRFEIEAPTLPATLLVEAEGFAPLAVEVDSAARELRLSLHPAGLVEHVSVTASRGTGAQTPSAVSVLTAAELVARAAGSLDDALRHTPGFSLFRRASSRVANPTTQGVTLRGVSGSGASRTLVLADGFPLNDPFGSWVYWNRIPLLALERVEVVRGAGGDLYGADALGGVIQLLSFDATAPRLRFAADTGSRSSGRVSGLASGRLGAWTGELAGEWARTGDFPVVAPDERGSVDAPAGADYRSGFAVLGYESAGWRGRLRASAASEDRKNGTPLQENATRWHQVSADASGVVAGGALRLLAAFADQTYEQSFSALSADRSTERLTTTQHVPADVISGAAHWARAWGRHTVLVGVEGRRVSASVEQLRFAPTGARSGPFEDEGVERTLAAFARSRLAVPGHLSLTLAGRLDEWRSEAVDGAGEARSVRFVSPRLAVEWRPPGPVAVFAAASSARRTPTLNELYRGFRVGNVVTSANPDLVPERLRNLEAGVSLSGARGSLRLTGFDGLLRDAVANVTLSASPELIERQRRNAGEVVARGFELEAELRPGPAIRLGAFAAVTSSRFRGTPELPELEGKRVPQVPRLHLGASFDWSAPWKLSLSAQLRFTSEQFDDDLNQLPLGSFTLVDASLWRPLGSNLQAFVSVENLTDAEYDVARTPTRSVGLPRTFRGGVRLFLP